MILKINKKGNVVLNRKPVPVCVPVPVPENQNEIFANKSFRLERKIPNVDLVFRARAQVIVTNY
jgi:hypothetical protein